MLKYRWNVAPAKIEACFFPFQSKKCYKIEKQVEMLSLTKVYNLSKVNYYYIIND